MDSMKVSKSQIIKEKTMSYLPMNIATEKTSSWQKLSMTYASINKWMNIMVDKIILLRTKMHNTILDMRKNFEKMQFIDLQNMLKFMHEMYEEKRNPNKNTPIKRRRNK
tara:strand:+ start:1728 stop:2054 length:327 start_codon:yes stop_codon:yes gene_type:complete